MTKEYSDYLAHHGIKGMHWYETLYPDRKKGGVKKRQKKNRPESATWKAKDKRQLSDEELNRRNQRLNKENQYVNNVNNNHPAKKAIKEAVRQIFVAAAIGVAADVVRKKLGSTAPFEFIKKCANYKLPL